MMVTMMILGIQYLKHLIIALNDNYPTWDSIQFDSVVTIEYSGE